MLQPIIAVIAPYERLAMLADKVIRDEGYPARVLQGDLPDGVRAAAKAVEQGAKVIVSRGGTAKLIQAELGGRLDTEVIEIETSWRGLVSYLHAHAEKGMRIAITGFSQFTRIGRFAAESLGIAHRVFEIGCEQDAAETADNILAWKADVVLGDAVSERLIEHRSGIRFHLIESSSDSVREALDKAMMLVNNLQRTLTHNRRLSAVLECSQDGVVIVDDDGVVEKMNQPGMALLGASGARLIGARLADILRSRELADALREKREARSLLIEHAGEQLHVNLNPLNQADGVSSGSVVSLQQVKSIQAMEGQIRSRLHRKGFHAKHALADIVHRSEPMRQAIRLAQAYARSDANVVITGETGTGKELFAQGIHNASPRAGGMFVAINCAALPASLMESELFGYSPGAFTGAAKQGKTGLFELAHDGTVFLDEITEMDPHLQSRLLRAIQEREIMRIGDNKVIPVNVRVIAAANRDLECEVATGRLRQDLFFRLNVLNLRLPALREREGDAALLFRHFLAEHASRIGIAPADPAADFLSRLEQYDWPGNVRELENAAEKYIVLRDMPEARGLPSPSPTAKEEESAAHSLDAVIREAIRKALDAEDGNITRASRRLGVNRNTVKRWLRDEGP